MKIYYLLSTLFFSFSLYFIYDFSLTGFIISGIIGFVFMLFADMKHYDERMQRLYNKYKQI